jgi:hypothetical protein
MEPYRIWQWQYWQSCGEKNIKGDGRPKKRKN